MDAKEAQLKEKFEFHLKQATEVAAQLQAIEQGDRVPHYDEIELPAHAMGQRFSRAIKKNGLANWPSASLRLPLSRLQPTGPSRDRTSAGDLDGWSHRTNRTSS